MHGETIRILIHFVRSYFESIDEDLFLETLRNTNQRWLIQTAIASTIDTGGTLGSGNRMGPQGARVLAKEYNRDLGSTSALRLRNEEKYRPMSETAQAMKASLVEKGILLPEKEGEESAA